MSRIVRLAAAAILVASAAPIRAATVEELNKQIESVAGEQLTLQMQNREREERLNRAMNDPKQTSPEIEALRQRLETLRREIVTVQGDLRARIEELPELREDAAAVKTERARLMDLDRRRRDLLQQRARLLSGESENPPPQ